MNRAASWLLWIAVVGLQPVQESRAAEPDSADIYLQTLLEQARTRGLSASRTWRVLLHYRDHRFGNGVTSEVDDDYFFFAPDGKTSPESELEATLRAFFSSARIGEREQFPRCAFPARFQWLDSQLGFDRARMPEPECPLIELWRTRVNAGSASLVFSSYYLNNPASMFGHTLLRLNSADRTQPQLLDFALNYAADIEQSEGIFDYAWRGLTGGFDGRFAIFPYYDRVKVYNDLENRDLWEYRLSLEPEQIEFMLLHAWELVNTRFDFYFLRENCSYHLLSLLEAADPELDLRSRYRVWTLPTETVRLINAQPGLVTAIAYRPSLRNQAEARIKRLAVEDRRRARALAEFPATVDGQHWQYLPAARRAEIVGTAIELVRYDGIRKGEDPAQTRLRLHELLVHRSRLPAATNRTTFDDPPPLASPHQGHDSLRLELAAGHAETDGIATGFDGSYVELSIQPGYHDLLAGEDGQAPDSQIRILGLAARYYEDAERWQVQEAALLDIVSLQSTAHLGTRPSWKLYLGWRQNRDGACADCTPFIVNPGIGIATGTRLHRKETFYALIEADLQFDHEIADDYRAGIGARAGLTFDAGDHWRIGLDARRTHYNAGDPGYVSEITLGQRFPVKRNVEIRFDLRTIEEYREATIGFAHYF